MKGGVITLVGVLALLAVGAGPAAAACGGVKHVRPKADRNPGAAPLAIGDSVLLGALDEVSRAGFEIDTRGCRQVDEGLALLRRRRRGLPRFVVMALGSNGAARMGQIRAARRILGPRRVLGLVVPTRQRQSAAVFRRAGRRYRRVVTLDWARYSAGRSGWFGGDGIHLGRPGAAGLARLLGRGLRRLYPLQTRFSGEPGRGGYAAP